MHQILGSVFVSVTFLLAVVVCTGFTSSDGGLSAASPQQSAALQWFFRKIGKRGALLNKCDQYSACALLQLQPGTQSYWTEEICHCEEGNQCSFEWDEIAADGKSVNNADTQLKLCRPTNTLPNCMRDQTAVTSTMETSVVHPSIRQGASVFCSCPRTDHQFKLQDAGMVDEGERTVISAHFECVPVEHCRVLQPCTFLAVLPTGDTLVHQSCECESPKKCPRDLSTTGIVPALLDEITYYPFFCD